MPKSPKTISLASLVKLSKLTANLSRYQIDCAAVCFSRNNHNKEDIQLHLKDGSILTSLSLRSIPVTKQMLRTTHDNDVAAEHGAIGLAILLLKLRHGRNTIQQSRKGGGFDYYVREGRGFMYQGADRLEVSGIFRGSDDQVKQRVGRKIKQTQKSDDGSSAFVVVVEFSKPTAVIVVRS